MQKLFTLTKIQTTLEILRKILQKLLKKKFKAYKKQDLI